MKVTKVFLYCSTLLISSCITSQSAYADSKTDCNGGRYNQSVCGNVKQMNIYKIPNDSSQSPIWRLNKHYNKGDIVVFKEQKYQCIQSHNSDAYNWSPPEVQSLWRGL